jgi:Ser/Thr protein kinase RdoA (MazF antagonist)
VLLPAEQLVSKVSTSTLGGHGGDALERELRLGQHLAEHGAAIAHPARPEIAGPHNHRGMTLTFWRHHEPQARPSDADVELGEALSGFHAALAGVATALPSLAERFDRAAELFKAPSATPDLAETDRRAAAPAHSRLRALVDSLDSAIALHGEPHEDNVIWTESGPLLIDFEAACAGPVEWDLAYLPDASLSAFPDRDDEAVAKLRSGVSFCVAAWCWANPARAPEVAAAARFHVDAFRRSWLAA